MCWRTTKKMTPADPAVLSAVDYLARTYNDLHTIELCNTPVGHWVNEAFVVRLWAAMEAHHVVGGPKSINESLPGWEHVAVCRLLRHQIVHATGEITSKKARSLDRRLRMVFGLANEQSMFEGRFILSKETVLEPMRSKCREYCSAVLDWERAGGG